MRIKGPTRAGVGTSRKRLPRPHYCGARRNPPVLSPQVSGPSIRLLSDSVRVESQAARTATDPGCLWRFARWRAWSFARPPLDLRQHTTHIHTHTHTLSLPLSLPVSALTLQLHDAPRLKRRATHNASAPSTPAPVPSSPTLTTQDEGRRPSPSPPHSVSTPSLHSSSSTSSIASASLVRPSVL